MRWAISSWVMAERRRISAPGFRGRSACDNNNLASFPTKSATAPDRECRDTRPGSPGSAIKRRVHTHFALFLQQIHQVLAADEIHLARRRGFGGHFVVRARNAALSPMTSPASACFRISTLPSFEVVESFTLPEQRMNTPRGVCPSTNSSAPGGITL
jgi:hypothetical protein